jgi:hypothetical protein
MGFDKIGWILKDLKSLKKLLSLSEKFHDFVLLKSFLKAHNEYFKKFMKAQNSKSITKF